MQFIDKIYTIKFMQVFPSHYFDAKLLYLKVRFFHTIDVKVISRIYLPSFNSILLNELVKFNVLTNLIDLHKTPHHICMRAID